MINNIELFTQSSIRIRGSFGIVCFDPFRMKEEPKDADYILITHDHMDHFSPEDLKKTAGENCILIVPQKLEAQAKKEAGFVKEIRTVEPARSYEIEGLRFETVPAYNTLKPFHQRSAGWVGYILEADGQRIYVAGDTDAVKEARAVKCDIAMVPVGGTFTMNAKKAAELVNEIRPAVAIPTHYGGIVGSREDAKEFAALVKEPIRVEIIMQG